jgi:hypothetical protein
MSLINDSLKRAMQARPKGPATAAGPELRPVETPARPRGFPSILLPLCAAVLLVAAGVLFWRGFSSGNKGLKVRASTPAPVVAAAPAPVQPAVAAAAPTNTVVGTVAAEPVTNPPAVAQSPKPEPITYRLQSIFYRVKDPSAVINGKTIFLGDRVGGARVLAIGQDSVTILTPTGQTNILDLQ